MFHHFFFYLVGSSYFFCGVQRNPAIQLYIHVIVWIFFSTYRFNQFYIQLICSDGTVAVYNENALVSVLCTGCCTYIYSNAYLPTSFPSTRPPDHPIPSARPICSFLFVQIFIDKVLIVQTQVYIFKYVYFHKI